jgi:hypothetical protein
MNIYWGDVHNHCNISYGLGSLENALCRAREHLDFCAVTGHAMWPDIPAREPRLEYLIDYHLRGFAKLAAGWEHVRQTLEAANVPAQFVTFQSYEIHSRRYGDHHILSPAGDLPLIEADSPHSLLQALKPRPAIAIPHHVAYVPGYRGIDWNSFSSTASPVMEVYSKHGSSMSDGGIYPFLHDMGPRDGRNTVRAGLNLGHCFGFVASTDHHGGYPGSYGDGRLAALATDKTRDAIWEAILARRTYAVTGDKIACLFRINEQYMGSEVRDASVRDIELDIRACDAIDKVTVYKNGKPWRVHCGDISSPLASSQTFKVRIEMGWGHSLEGFPWEGHVTVTDGDLLGVEPCFRGQSVLAPSQAWADNPDINALDNRIVSQTANELSWVCTTFKNPTMMHPQTNAVILELLGDAHTKLDVELNGKRLTATLAELNTSRGVHLQDYTSKAFLVHRALPETAYCLHLGWEDRTRASACDVYDAEVRQYNGQCAWISPIFVMS